MDQSASWELTASQGAPQGAREPNTIQSQGAPEPNATQSQGAPEPNTTQSQRAPEPNTSQSQGAPEPNATQSRPDGPGLQGPLEGNISAETPRLQMNLTLVNTPLNGSTAREVGQGGLVRERV